MPVQLSTVFGKTDYSVVRALQDLTAAVNLLEGFVADQRRSGLSGDLLMITQQVQQLTARLDLLAAKVKALEDAP